MQNQQNYRVISSKNYTTLTHNKGCPEHLHENCEFLFILTGEVENTVNTYKTDLRAGDILFINKNVIHCIKEKNNPYNHRDIYISTENLKKICSELFDDKFFDYLISDDKGIPIHVSAGSFLDISNHLSELEILYGLYTDEENKNIIRSCIRSVIINLLGILYKDFSLPNFQSKKWLVDFIQEIQSPQIFTLKESEIIALSHYSNTHFCNIFKKTYNFSFKDYLTRLKISYAKSLLKSTDESILTVAINCGYDTQSHFTQFFKKITGMTPSEYRQSKIVAPPKTID